MPTKASHSSLRWPWLDRAGRFSVLKAATLVLVVLPGLWIGLRWGLGQLGAKPVTAAIHKTGDWAVYFLIASLAVTPLRRIANLPKLILVRRILGLAVLGCALIHLFLYCLDQAFDLGRIASEIVLRIYLTIGFTALVGLAVLGATSTDAAIRRLGQRWNTLHKLVYAIGVLALLHYFLQSKLNVTQPVLWTGFFFLLMGYRLMLRAGIAHNPLTLAGLAAVAAALTALAEAGWYAARTGANASLVLSANLDFSFEIRPMWWVFAAGLAAAAVNLVRGSSKPARGRRGGALRPADA